MATGDPPGEPPATATATGEPTETSTPGSDAVLAVIALLGPTLWQPVVRTN